jgi:hypothetical protein
MWTKTPLCAYWFIKICCLQNVDREADGHCLMFNSFNCLCFFQLLQIIIKHYIEVHYPAKSNLYFLFIKGPLCQTFFQHCYGLQIVMKIYIEVHNPAKSNLYFLFIKGPLCLFLQLCYGLHIVMKILQRSASCSKEVPCKLFIKGTLCLKNASILIPQKVYFIFLLYFYSFQKFTHWPIIWTIFFICCFLAVSTVIVI